MSSSSPLRRSKRKRGAVDYTNGMEVEEVHLDSDDNNNREGGVSIAEELEESWKGRLRHPSLSPPRRKKKVEETKTVWLMDDDVVEELMDLDLEDKEDEEDDAVSTTSTVPLSIFKNSKSASCQRECERGEGEGGRSRPKRDREEKNSNDGEEEEEQTSSRPRRGQQAALVKKTYEEIHLTYVFSCGADSGEIRLYKSDLDCLKPGEFLNDKVIDFWTNHIYKRCMDPGDRKLAVVFSSLFYTSLKAFARKHLAQEKEWRRWKKKRRTQANGGVSDDVIVKRPRHKWAKEVDLFTKDFIFIPISEGEHWILAVLCYPGMVYNNSPEIEERYSSPYSSPPSSPRPTPTEEERTPPTEEEKKMAEYEEGKASVKTYVNKRVLMKDQVEPMILIFDSFQDYGTNHERIAKLLGKFLEIEWEARYGVELSFERRYMPLLVPMIPQQGNSYDCGPYLLQAFETFFITPLPRAPPLPDLSEWFDRAPMRRKRKVIRQLILEWKEEEAEIQD